MKKSESRTRLFKVSVYLVLIAMAISIIVPVGWVFLASIKENAEFYGNPWALPKGIFFQNFINAFTKAKMGDYFLNSIIVTALALVILLAVALPCAYVLARYDFKGKKILNTLYNAGLFINVNYIVVPIFLMLLGWDDTLYKLFHVEFFLNNLFVLALVYAATAIPFTVYLLASYFETQPRAFEEAAFIDGATYGQTLRKIMVPMAMPSIVTVILFNFLAFWNEYIIALTLIPGSNKTLPVGLVNLSQAAHGKAEYGTLYAGLVIVMLPTLILYCLVQKKLTQGMTVGGVKE